MNIPKYHLGFSELHGYFVRYHHTEHDGMIAVMDRNTLKELPDLIHPTQIKWMK